MMKKALVAVTLATSLTGCATVFDSGSKTINIAPSDGANVKAQIAGPSGVQDVTLPTTYAAERAKGAITVTVTDKCYEKTNYVAQSKITPAFFGNILFGLVGITGTVVDSSNGNMWTYDQSITVPTSKKANCK